MKLVSIKLKNSNFQCFMCFENSSTM